MEKDSGTELAVHRGRRRRCRTSTLTVHSSKVAALGLERDIVVATCLAFAELTREKAQVRQVAVQKNTFPTTSRPDGLPGVEAWSTRCNDVGQQGASALTYVRVSKCAVGLAARSHGPAETKAEQVLKMASDAAPAGGALAPWGWVRRQT